MELDSCQYAPLSWPRRTIGEICERFTSGGTPSRSKPEFYGGEIPWVKTKELTDGMLWSTEECITDAGLAGSSAKLLPTGTILMAMYGATVGKLARIGREMACNQACAAMVVDPSQADASYLYFQLKLNRPKIVSSATGAAQQNLSGQQIKNFILPFPEVGEQRRIGHLLVRLDDKIELNRRMNETLEAMAHAIFRDWFVDFGPVHRKLGGETDPVVVMGGLTPDPSRAAELAALFPDALDDSGLPVGWSTEPVIDQAHWVNGAAYKKMHFVLPEEGLPVIKIAELKAGVTANTGFTNTNLGGRYRIDDGELLFSWSGNPDTSIDTFIWTGGPAWLNQHIFAVRPNGSRTLGFLFAMLKYLNPTFAEIARDKQTTGLGHVTKEDLKRLRQAVPEKPIEAAFDALMTPIFEKLKAAQLENRTLVETRDYLLPRLMSGAVRVKEAPEQDAAA